MQHCCFYSAKNFKFAILACLVLIIGCQRRDREVQCTGSLVKRDAMIYFVGFLGEELDTIRVIQYQDDSFATVIDSMTVVTAMPFFQGDTASRENALTPFVVAKPGMGYDIFLPGSGSGRAFRISNLQYIYSGTTFTYTSTDCKARTFTNDPIAATVTGGEHLIKPGSIGARVFLKK